MDMKIDIFTSNVSKIFNHFLSNCSVIPFDDTSHYFKDLFTLEERLHGAVFIYIFFGLYIFIVVAYVCSDYFLPSVYCICKDLNLSQAVAGVTFMSMVTGAPELSMNFIGTFLTHSDIGIGEIVGGSIFNTIGIPACAGLATAVVIPLDIWPLYRESGIYVAVIMLLTAVLWDSTVMWYEAILLVTTYIVYLLVLLNERRLYKIPKRYFSNRNVRSSVSGQHRIATLSQVTMEVGTYTSSEVKSVDSIFPTVDPVPLQTNLKSAEIIPVIISMNEPDIKAKGIFNMPEGMTERLWWLFSWPVVFSLWLTIPDCRRKRHWYPVTFIMCIIWIACTSYLISWMMTTVGNTFGISDAVMGLTILAIAGAIPDALSAIFNARNGIGTMSVSNGLGENTMDIMLALGLPWTIKTLLPHDMGGGPVIVQSHGLVFILVAPLMAVVSLLIVAALNGFKLSRGQGVACLVLYFIIVIAAIILELYLNKLQDEACR